MPSRRVTPTRHSLLETNEELTTAERGLDILERRRDRLVFVMLDLLERFRELEASLEEAYATAVTRRTDALELDGIVALKAAAEARPDHAEFLPLTQQLEGLPVPLFLSHGISKRLDERGYGLLGTSAAIDETAETHEAVLDLLIRTAELEITLRIFLLEIRRTNVRVHGLRSKVIPDLEARKAYIEFHLAEREREERNVQRFFKRRRE